MVLYITDGSLGDLGFFSKCRLRHSFGFSPLSYDLADMPLVVVQWHLPPTIAIVLLFLYCAPSRNGGHESNRVE